MRDPSIRLALFYACYFLVMGVQLPFWPTWLAASGMSGPEIGVLVAVSVWARAVANPFFAHHADRVGERRRPMLWLAWLSLGSFALFAVPGGFAWLLVVSLLFGMLYAPLLALGESLTVLSSRSQALDYGRIRLWGSLTFIVAAVGSGELLEGRGPGLVLALVIGLLLAVALVCHGLPDERTDRAAPEHRSPVRRLLGSAPFLWFLLATSAVQSSHALYYAFGTLHWQAAGHAEGTIGILWAEGVVAEIVLFAYGAHVMRRYRAVTLIALGAAAGVVRWVVTAWTTDLSWLLVVQPLHALTYGATHLGAIRFLAQRVDPTISASAQSLYGAVANGLVMGSWSIGAGVLYEELAGVAYLFMAGSSALGLFAVVALLRLGRRSAEN